ncbi:MAG: hypothetical protein H7338_01170 [Candidatus Sericytochromatia bacterium]|nr:hypothetical protein [Candidatus Sericytochromatia bacterium]
MPVPDLTPPPALSAPSPAASDALSRSVPAVVATPPTAFWARFGQDLQGYAAVWQDWRGRHGGDGIFPAVEPASIVPASLFPMPPHVPQPGSILAVQAAFLRATSYVKHIGMPSLGLDQEVIGYVSTVSLTPNRDGDFTIDIVPLPAYAPILMYEGRYRPRVPQAGAISKTANTPRGIDLALRCGAIHCEIKADRLRTLQPFLREVLALVRAGNTPIVAIRGRWTFDGFHAGWVEIHPARTGHLVSRTGDGYPEPLPLPHDGKGGTDDEP